MRLSPCIAGVDAGRSQRGQINQQPRPRATDLRKRDSAARGPPANGAGRDAGDASRLGDANPILRSGHGRALSGFSVVRFGCRVLVEVKQPGPKPELCVSPNLRRLFYIRRPPRAARYCSNESHRVAPWRARRTLNARTQSPHRLRSHHIAYAVTTSLTKPAAIIRSEASPAARVPAVPNRATVLRSLDRRRGVAFDELRGAKRCGDGCRQGRLLRFCLRPLDGPEHGAQDSFRLAEHAVMVDAQAFGRHGPHTGRLGRTV